MSKQTLKFPKKFMWGAATAAHQVEGGNHNQWSAWEAEMAKTLAKQAEYHYGDLPNWEAIKQQATSPDNYVSGKLADHFSNYEVDFDLMERLGFNAYRFSVEWSRIEPSPGTWDPAAISHYKRYVSELKQRGIEPVVTLFHFSLPTWFAEIGAFEKRANVKYFVRFAEKIISELGLSVRHIITINEPEVYATESYWHGSWPPAIRSRYKWWRVVNNMAYAHRQAAKSIRAINRRYKLSIAKNSNYFYPGDDAWLSRLSARTMQYFQDDYFLRKVKRQLDFIGVNYYFTNRVYGYRIHNPDQDSSDLGWDLQPADIQYVLERLYQKYRLPIIITENGLADHDDSRRQDWLAKTIRGIAAALSSGVDVRGYLHWSLIDNFEWNKGKWPRFGLVEIDYKTKKRRLRPSAVWYGRVIRKIRGIDESR